MLDRYQFKLYLKELPNFFSIFFSPSFFFIASIALIEISKETGINMGNLTLIFTFFYLGNTIGKLLSYYISRFIGSFYTIIISYFLIIAVIILLTISRKIFLFYICYSAVGFFIGMIWMQAFEYLMKSKIKNKSKLLNTALIFYPLGSLLTPIISSKLLKLNLGWEFIYYYTIILAAIIIILYFGIMKKIIPINQNEEKLTFREFIIFKSVRKNYMFILILLAIITYCIAQNFLTTWYPTYFRINNILTLQFSGYVIALFWLSVIIGRIITGFLIKIIREDIILVILSSIALCSLLLFIIFDNRLLVSEGLLIYEKGNKIKIVLIMLSSNLGFMLSPFINKYFANKNMIFSIDVPPVLIFINCLLIIMYMILKNRGKKLDP